MFERFTKPARELVERATEIATESRASQTRPEHLFAALLWDDHCLAVRVLDAAGRYDASGCTTSSTDVVLGTSTGWTTRTRRRWPASASTSRRSCDGSGDGDLGAGVVAGARGSRVRRRRCSSCRCARRSRCEHNYIGTEHILLGLVREGDPIVRDTLRACGRRHEDAAARRRRSRTTAAELARSPSCVTKSISSSTRPSRAGSRSWKPRTPPRMCFHARAMSAWSRCGQPHCWQTPCFHSMLRGTFGHSFLPSRSGCTAAQMSMNGWPTISTCLPIGDFAHRLGDPALLRARHQVVDEYADPPLGPRLEVAQLLAEVVDPVEVLHDHALDAQVVTPHLLDELGVVPALDEDAAGPRDPGLDALDGDRPGRRTCRRRRTLAGRGDQHDRTSLEQEAGAEREGAPLVAPVLEGQRAEVALDLDDLAAPVGGHLLDDEAEVGVDLDRAALLRGAPVGGEHVGAVTVMGEGVTRPR